MKKKKITLKSLSVTSFITNLDKQAKKTAIGGRFSDWQGCTDNQGCSANGTCESIPVRACDSAICDGNFSLDHVACSAAFCSHGGGGCPEISVFNTCPE